MAGAASALWARLRPAVRTTPSRAPVCVAFVAARAAAATPSARGCAGTAHFDDSDAEPVVEDEEELFVLEWEQLVLPLEGLVELGYLPTVKLVIV